jgi:chromosome segregation ATPase
VLNDVRTSKEEIARIKADDRGLDSLERQIQELFRLIAKKESGGNPQREDVTRTQTLLKQGLQRMQDQLDAMHKTLFDKPDKSSIDSNFMVLQNEMDNLNVKLKFYEHKNSQLEENLRGMISGYSSEMA